jgi:molecular chaperone HscB
MNYFEFYGLTISFLLDESALKSAFYAKSKALHPDFFTLETEEKQAEILELSTLNNQAYQTLSNFDRRMKYVLGLFGLLKEEGKNEIPQDFLFEIMEVNEAIMELESGFDEGLYRQARLTVEALDHQLLEEIMPRLKNFEAKNPKAGELEAIRDFFLKKRYLLRLFENLDKFAPA